jgi:general secretion pathway protein A
MYAPFFGLSKEPFSIAPDPRFLFMSDMHREALAHLLYGVSGGGGFVLLTGEIGAGKTTVCRAFLDQVPAHCAVAYIFNPKLTVIELLQTICEEFGVEAPVAKGGPRAEISVKDYVDALNRFLLSAHAAGCHTVLIIDEAQSLAADVLEQLRLLTNLETAERKLLQIVLIGQPELRDLLAQPALEQLAQRVIARFHLRALSAAETGQYIQHRLAVAGPSGGREPFDKRSLARIHALTGGVPRRINLLCDRALLGAYAHGQHRVTQDMVETAAREVFVPARIGVGAASIAAPPLPRRSLVWAGVAALAVLLLGAGWAWRVPLAQSMGWQLAGVPAAGSVAGSSVGSSVGSPASPSAATAVASAASLAAAKPAAAVVAPADAVALTDSSALVAAAWPEEAAAWRDLAGHWRLSLADTAELAPCDQALATGLVCYRNGNGLSVLRQVARPALLVLRTEGADPVFAKLLGVGATGATLAVGDQRWRLSLPALARVWRGEFFTFWRAPPGWRPGPDALDAPATQTWLQQRLAAAGVPADLGSVREQVRTFQIANGLAADGLAGPMTLMLLGRTDEPGLLQDR